MAKNKFPGSVLALLLPLALSACGGSDSSDGGTRASAIPAAWRTVHPFPTSMNLRGGVFTSRQTGVVVGESGTLFRYTDLDATGLSPNIVWFQHEPQPISRQADFVAIDTLGDSFYVAGNDTTGGKFWFSSNAYDWLSTDTPGSGAPFTGVDVILSSLSAGTNALFLRNNGDVVASAGTPLIANSGVTTALGLDFLGNTGEGYVCGSNGGTAAVRGCSTFSTDPLAWTSMIFDGGAPAGSLEAIQMTTGLVTVAGPSTVVARTGCTVGENGIIRVLQQFPTGGTPPTEFRWKAIVSGVATHLRDVHFPLDHSVGWAVGDAGVVLKLTYSAPGAPTALPEFNYTVTPQALNPSTTQVLNDVWFLDANTGFIVGDQGLVYRTINGGTTWTRVSGGARNHVNAADFAADGVTGIAVGENGFVVRTRDGGASWTTTNSGLPGGATWHGISIPKGQSPPMAFLCGSGGVFRCTDLTATPLTWTAMSGLPVAVYRSVHFAPGAGTGAVVAQDPVGGNPAVVFSTTSGDAPSAASVLWTQGTLLPADTSFFSATANPGGSAFYVGGIGGLIYTSTPAAFPAWTQVVQGPNSPTGDVISLQAPGGALTLVAADGDGSVHRLDTSPAWSLSGALVGNVVSIGFESPTTGYAATQGPGGGIFRTVNGGVTWTQQVIHNTNTMRFVGSSNAFVGGGWACGENGTVVLTSSGGH